MKQKHKTRPITAKKRNKSNSSAMKLYQRMESDSPV